MTNQERFDEIDRIIDEQPAKIDIFDSINVAAKIIAYLTDICKEQQKQIEDLQELTIGMHRGKLRTGPSGNIMD